MNKDALVKRLMATFVDELDDQVRAFNGALLELEKSEPGPSRAELLKRLLRSAHSLKGASASVNVRLIESCCHQLESVFGALENGELPFGPELYVLLFAAVDAIEDAGKRLRREEDPAGGRLAAIVPKIESLAASRPRATQSREGPALVPPSPGEAPAAATLPAVASSATEQEEPPSTVRVDAKKLDALLAQSGEFFVAYRRLQLRIGDLDAFSGSVTRWCADWSRLSGTVRSALNGTKGVLAPQRAPLSRLLPAQLDQTTEDLNRLLTEWNQLLASLAADMHHLGRAAGALDEEVRRVRLLPFGDACMGLDRMARDLAQEHEKEVSFSVEAGDVELDRSMLEGVKDSLRHLVRNALYHGIETPDERRAAGKSPRGQIAITAMLRGPQVEVTVADDGRGLDLAALRESLRNKRVAEPADERELAKMIFLPGISTARLVTDVSGRGMGLDIVKGRAEAAHGAVDVSFQPGRGTCVTMALPLTLTSLRSLLVRVADQTFGFVGTSIQKTGRLDPATLKRVEGRDMLASEEGLVPVASLADMLGLSHRPPLKRGASAPFVVIAAGGRRIAMLVDEHLAEQEIMIKSLGARIECLPYIAGATILPTGRIALVLNAASLIRASLERTPAPLIPARPEGTRKRLLLAEDSVTTRTLIASILADAGYDVATTPDGAAAWQALQDRGADLLITDVAMPRMDGFALTEAVRNSSRFRDLPVVLVTARETNEDKARGAAAGADAYLVKSAFDQRRLLETIAQLL